MIHGAVIKIVLSIFLLFFVSNGQTVALTEENIKKLANRAMKKFQAPGIAIAVVSNDKVIHAKGYGVRSIDSSVQVDKNTIFQIASLTKAFTALALGILVDEDRISWEDSVIDYLPEFRMNDPWVTREFTIRDLLTHRSGLALGAGDLLFWPNAKSTAMEVVKSLRHLKAETSFRSNFAYDNVLYVVAGEVVRTVSGMSWSSFVENQIMHPLGMENCRALPSKMEGASNRAIPHMLVEGTLQTTYFSGGGATVAAGGINCDISGLSKWAKMLLAKGKLPNGKSLISEKTHAELWMPVTLLPVKEFYKKHGRTQFNTYSLGWFISDFYGYKHVAHGGALQGMTSHIAIIPEKDIAVIALSNQWSAAPRSITYELLQTALLLDTASSQTDDWVELFSEAESNKSVDAKKEVKNALANRNLESSPSLPFSSYIGTYHDPWYGDVFVKIKYKKLLMEFGRTELLVGTLEHFQYDTFIVKWNDRSLGADSYVDFDINTEGKVETIKMKAVSAETDFSFDFHHLLLKKIKENQK